ALVDPHGSVLVASDTLTPFHQVMLEQSWKFQQTARLSASNRELKGLRVAPWLEVVFVDTDDTGDLGSVCPARRLSSGHLLLLCLDSSAFPNFTPRAQRCPQARRPSQITTCVATPR